MKMKNVLSTYVHNIYIHTMLYIYHILRHTDFHLPFHVHESFQAANSIRLRKNKEAN